MRELVFTNEARQDLREIWAKISGDNGDARADILLSGIYEKCALLVLSPVIGTARPELRTGMRSLPYKSWTIYFITEPGEVLILRILHGRRDPQRENFNV